MTFVRSRARGVDLYKSIAGALAFAAAAWGVSPVARAANADQLKVELDVKPVDPASAGASTPTYSVSVSRSGLNSYASYKVKMTNGSTNTVNQVVFTGKTTVKPDSAGAAGTAPYKVLVNIGAASPNCAAPPVAGAAEVSSATCTVGQLKGGESREFFLIFQAPTAGQSIEFSGDTTFSSGNSSSAPPANYTQHVENSMTLTTVDSVAVNKAVNTVLPPSGGTFFTGANGQVDATNLSSTSVLVPSTASNPVVTDNRIQQLAPVPSYACAPLVGYFCYGLSSQVDIRNAKDGTKVYFNTVVPGQYVTILLRQDAASLTVKKPTPAPGDVRILYSANGGTPIEVLACTSAGPSVDTPCVFDRRSFLKGKKGYYEYELHAVDNGVFSW